MDCFVTVGGGPLDLVSKCQLAGEATTDPLPVRDPFPLSPLALTLDNEHTLLITRRRSPRLVSQVPTGYSISVSNAVEDPLTDPTQELLVKVEEDVGRIALLESIFAEDGSASRNYDVTFEVQCLVRGDQRTPVSGQASDLLGRSLCIE